MQTSAVTTEPELSFVLPVFREQGHIHHSLLRLAEIANSLNLSSWEMVVVDDGSDDGTWQAVQQARKSISRLRLVRFSRNFGKESALCAGLDVARGKAVMILDGDLQHPPEMIPEFVRAWREGFLIVEGVKSDRGKENLAYGLVARLFYRVLSSATGFDFRHASDFKLLDRQVVNAWKQLPERNVFFRGMIGWLGFPKKQIPFLVAERASGTSSFNMISLVRLAWAAISAYSAWPLHAITIFGLVFSLISAALLVQTMVNKVMGTAFTGFTTVISLQLLIGSALILSIGVLGEYIAKIFEEVKQRPRYVVLEMEPAEEMKRDRLS